MRRTAAVLSVAEPERLVGVDARPDEVEVAPALERVAAVPTRRS
ncbi:hypothetical protein TOK_5757 [Pseudonocardia sp. N23]|nr:hypothetical protein TOK_5757 [Pseudonocardia sp. N23]